MHYTKVISSIIIVFLNTYEVLLHTAIAIMVGIKLAQTAKKVHTRFSWHIAHS